MHEQPSLSQQTANADRLARYRATIFVAQLLGLMVLVHLVGFLTGYDLGAYGIQPRRLMGLRGIPLAPLLHGSWYHLFANLPSLVISGFSLAWVYPRLTRPVIIWTALLGGGLIWLLGRGGSAPNGSIVTHLGASGLVYGLFGFLLISGLVRRERAAMAAGLIAAFMNQGILYGALPGQPGVSWEAHAFSLLIGVLLAILYRNKDKPPPRPETTAEDEALAQSLPWDYHRHAEWLRQQGRLPADDEPPPKYW